MKVTRAERSGWGPEAKGRGPYNRAAGGGRINLIANQITVSTVINDVILVFLLTFNILYTFF